MSFVCVTQSLLRPASVCINVVLVCVLYACVFVCVSSVYCTWCGCSLHKGYSSTLTKLSKHLNGSMEMLFGVYVCVCVHLCVCLRVYGQ